MRSRVKAWARRSLRSLLELIHHYPVNHLSPPLSYIGGSGAAALARSTDSDTNFLGGLVPPTAGYVCIEDQN